MKKHKQKFELNYKITDKDIRSLNNRVLFMYFGLYGAVALLGLGVGIAAIVLHTSIAMLVMGIALTVLGGFLLVCSILLLIAPKNYIVSAVLPSDEIVRHVVFDEDGIHVDAEGGAIEFDYHTLGRISNRKTHLLVYIDGKRALLVKDENLTGGTLYDLFAFICTKKYSNNPDEQDAVETQQAEESEKAGESEQNDTAETSDGE